MDDISEHYARQATLFGSSKQSTMRDVNIRDLEVELILRQLNTARAEAGPLERLLEVGCGNGYTAESILGRLSLDYQGVDYSAELLAIAVERGLDGVFTQGDVRSLAFADGSFDFAFSERCLINLTSEQDQERALAELARVLRPGGRYLAVEGVLDGLEKLNAARSVLGLEAIPEPFHNRYFSREAFLEAAAEYFVLLSGPELENFLSSYYFGSKVLYPALAREGDLIYNNAFVEFFRHLPPIGDYAYVRAFLLQRR